MSLDKRTGKVPLSHMSLKRKTYMDNEQGGHLSIEEKSRFISDTAEEMERLLDEDYKKVKLILENDNAPTESEFTLTVGTQNAYLG